MRHSEEAAHVEQGTFFSPAHGLLMPKGDEYAEEGKDGADDAQHALSVTAHAAAAEHAVAHAVDGVDIQAYEHPDDEAHPRVGRQEEHHAHAAQNAEHGNEGHEGGAEGAFSRGHRAAHHNYSGAHEGEGEERADAGHLTCHACRHEAGEHTHEHHEEHVAARRRVETLVDVAEHGRQQPVAAHAVEHAALPHEHHHYHARIAQQDGEHDASVEPREVGHDRAVGAGRAHVLHGGGSRRDAFHAGIFAVVHHADHHEREEYVEHGAKEQRAENADGHVAPGVNRFLRSGAHGIEAYVGEEEDSGAAQHAAPAEVAKRAGVFGDKRREVVGIDIEEADADEHDYHQQFQKYDEVVEARAALRAAGKDEREEHHDGYGGHVDDTALGGARRECFGQRQADIVHHHAEIAAPRNAHRNACHGVFEHQVPTDNPRHEFAHRYIRIRVGTARHGQHGGKLGVAQAGKGARYGGDEEGEADGRAGVLASHHAGHGEQPRADYHAHAERNQRARPQHAAHAVFAVPGGLGKQLPHRFFD